MASRTTTAQAAAPRSTAEAQRAKIVSRAVSVFSVAGFHATPVAAVASAAEVSPAYVFRLFPGKTSLFVATIEHCYARVCEALIEGGKSAGDATPDKVLEAMTAAYVDLIRDRDLIMLQVHAQAACDIPEVREAVRQGMAAVIQAVSNGSGADAASIQRFIAYGQLCHLVVLADLFTVDASWAHTISDGIKHSAPLPRG